MVHQGDDLSRINAFSRRLQELTSTRTEPWRFGAVCLNDDFPDRWDSNFLRVERSVGDSTATDLVAEADRLLAHLLHREVVVQDEAEGARLAGGFGALGWEVDRLLYMVRRRPVDRAADPNVAIDELALEEVRPLIVEVGRRGHGGLSDDDAGMLADFRRVLVHHANDRFFAARVDGTLAAFCELYTFEGIAQIEDVNTLEEFRGRGLARAIVTRAVHEGTQARAGLVFLVADDRGWPKELYRRLGFDPVGGFWSFTRLPEGGSDR